jgi:hypothetical protein
MRTAAWLLVAAALAVTAVAPGQLRSAAAARRSDASVDTTSLARVSFVKSGNGWVVEARGLDVAQVAQLRADAASALQVRVAIVESSLPAMLGRYESAGTTLRFTPTYPLVEGLTYVARLRPNARATTGPVRELSATFTVPRVSKVSPTRVVGIYPTDEHVPENLLRMYVVFSAPMSIGQSASHLRLLDDRGQTVTGAFLELEEELWDPSRRRLTVLFDPGRVKRGLRNNLQRGAPLKSGHDYRLVVDAGWLDGDGVPLGAPFARRLHVGTADRRSPEPTRWRISPIRSRGQAPLVVAFDEPLDRALVEESLLVVDERGSPVERSDRARLRSRVAVHSYAPVASRPLSAAGLR